MSSEAAGEASAARDARADELGQPSALQSEQPQQPEQPQPQPQPQPEQPQPEPEPEPEPALAGVASLADRQMEQLFQALPLHERKALGDWCRAQRGQPARPLYHNPQDKYDGQPHTWFVRTLDTGRHAKFEWPRMQMHAVPSMLSEEHLFKLSGRTFQQCAVPVAGATPPSLAFAPPAAPHCEALWLSNPRCLLCQSRSRATSGAAQAMCSQ